MIQLSSTISQKSPPGLKEASDQCQPDRLSVSPSWTQIDAPAQSKKIGTSLSRSGMRSPLISNSSGEPYWLTAKSSLLAGNPFSNAVARLKPSCKPVYNARSVDGRRSKSSEGWCNCALGG
jgi:hypothetical protein